MGSDPEEDEEKEKKFSEGLRRIEKDTRESLHRGTSIQEADYTQRCKELKLQATLYS